RVRPLKASVFCVFQRERAVSRLYQTLRAIRIVDDLVTVLFPVFHDAIRTVDLLLVEWVIGELDCYRSVVGLFRLADNEICASAVVSVWVCRDVAPAV